ncbi:hypothetical protein PQ465_19185 [Sphingobacterium oryzagri]|uniref:Uncharacterized protein n=1 Tax=Sphingobacterium oryzagri TaxID=3025669 RepID=A0ABY7WG10_9SPHI|nr:hypothetical protein [Sphingobacterium sp. KACC 22765]WDF68405.1 hypothetical protein PQ465_19185 [Sphingobacterium sp. KACC 22765]
MIKKLLTIIVTIAVVLSLALGMLFSYITRESKHNSTSQDKGKLDFVDMFDSNKVYIIGGTYMNNRGAKLYVGERTGIAIGISASLLKGVQGYFIYDSMQQTSRSTVFKPA